jgi:monoamine oxidase
MIYSDYIIVGAGLSGLYLANKLKNENVKVIEANYSLGGRLKSVHLKNLTYEAGGSRISQNHKRILTLIEELGISDHLKNLGPGDYNYIKNVVKKLEKLDPKILNGNSIVPLLGEYYGLQSQNELYDNYGYNGRAELLNAKDFTEYYHDSLSANFFHLRGGLDAIINKLSEGIDIDLGVKVTSIERKNRNYLLHTNDKKTYSCKKLILTIPQESLKSISFFDDINYLLDSVQPVPYVRIYMLFPKQNGKVWFHNLSAQIYNNIIRHVVPMNKEEGLLQIYCDSRYAQYWLNQTIYGNSEEMIVDILRKLHPRKKIPKPTYFKVHYWKVGIHLWKPNENSKDLYKKIIQPYDHPLFICGETYSRYQGWMEGSLQTADMVLKKLNGKSGGKKSKCITIAEVKKHNKKEDAWIAIHGKVYNISNWIPRHPGGNIIMQGIGKNATRLFEDTGHSSTARKILKNYYIGDLC